MTNAWQKRHEIELPLRGITKAALEELALPQLRLQAKLLDVAVCAIDDVGGFGFTSSSKLLHRFRPNITPIWDGKIANWYPNAKPNEPWEQWFNTVFDQVLSPENQACLKAVGEQLGPKVSLLRIWDMILWQSDAPR
jgi:hypothetical protein